MGLPDFHTVQQQFIRYHSSYSEFISAIVGSIEIFNYDGFGKLIYLQSRIIDNTALLAENDAIILLIDGVQVFSDTITEFKQYSYKYDVSFIYPLAYNPLQLLAIASRNGIQFNNNITLTYVKNNVGNLSFSRRFTVGLY